MYVPGRKVAKALGLHQNTLKEYANRGKMPCIRRASGQRRYEVAAWLREREPDAELIQYVGRGLN